MHSTDINQLTVVERIGIDVSGPVDGGHILIAARDADRLRQLVTDVTGGHSTSAYVLAGTLAAVLGVDIDELELS